MVIIWNFDLSRIASMGDIDSKRGWSWQFRTV